MQWDLIHFLEKKTLKTFFLNLKLTLSVTLKYFYFRLHISRPGLIGPVPSELGDFWKLKNSVGTAARPVPTEQLIVWKLGKVIRMLLWRPESLSENIFRNEKLQLLEYRDFDRNLGIFANTTGYLHCTEIEKSVSFLQ